MARAHLHMWARTADCIFGIGIGNRRPRITFAEAMHARFARCVRPARRRIGTRRKTGKARAASPGKGNARQMIEAAGDRFVVGHCRVVLHGHAAILAPFAGNAFQGKTDAASLWPSPQSALDSDQSPRYPRFGRDTIGMDRPGLGLPQAQHLLSSSRVLPTSIVLGHDN